MSENKLNISKEIGALLKKLELAPPDVAALHITPSKVVATVYRRNDQGHKFITGAGAWTTENKDEVVTSFSSGTPATKTVEYEVRT